MRCRVSTSSAESGRRTRRSVSSMGLLLAGTLRLIDCLRSAVGVLLGEKGTKKGPALLWPGPPCPYFVPERLRDRLPVGVVHLVHPGVGGDVVARAAVGVHRRKPYAKLTAFGVRREEQDLLPIRRPDGVARSTLAAVVADVGQVLAVRVDRVNLAEAPLVGVGLEHELLAVGREVGVAGTNVPGRQPL